MSSERDRETDRQTETETERAGSVPTTKRSTQITVIKKAVAEVSVCNFGGSLQAIARPLFSSDISALSVSVGVIRDLSGVSDLTAAYVHLHPNFRDREGGKVTAVGGENPLHPARSSPPGLVH